MKKILFLAAAPCLVVALVWYVGEIYQARGEPFLQVNILWSKQYPIILAIFPKRELVLIDSGIEQTFAGKLARHLFFYEKEFRLFVGSGLHAGATKGFGWLAKKFSFLQKVDQQDFLEQDFYKRYQLGHGEVLIYYLPNTKGECVSRCLALLLCRDDDLFQKCFLFMEQKQIRLQKYLVSSVDAYLRAGNKQILAAYLGKIKKGERLTDEILDLLAGSRVYLTPTGKYADEIARQVSSQVKEKPLSLILFEEGKEVSLSL